jgi:hypothetical protein
MTLTSFLLRVRYDPTCPPDVTPVRWRAMVAWLAARAALGEPPVYADPLFESAFVGTRPARSFWRTAR